MDLIQCVHLLATVWSFITKWTPCFAMLDTWKCNTLTLTLACTHGPLQSLEENYNLCLGQTKYMWSKQWTHIWARDHFETTFSQHVPTPWPAHGPNLTNQTDKHQAPSFHHISRCLLGWTGVAMVTVSVFTVKVRKFSSVTFTLLPDVLIGQDILLLLWQPLTRVNHGHGQNFL